MHIYKKIFHHWLYRYTFVTSFIVTGYSCFLIKQILNISFSTAYTYSHENCPVIPTTRLLYLACYPLVLKLYTFYCTICGCHRTYWIFPISCVWGWYFVNHWGETTTRVVMVTGQLLCRWLYTLNILYKSYYYLFLFLECSIWRRGMVD